MSNYEIINNGYRYWPKISKEILYRIAKEFINFNSNEIKINNDLSAVKTFKGFGERIKKLNSFNNIPNNNSNNIELNQSPIEEKPEPNLKFLDRTPNGTIKNQLIKRNTFETSFKKPFLNSVTKYAGLPKLTSKELVLTGGGLFDTAKEFSRYYGNKADVQTSYGLITMRKDLNSVKRMMENPLKNEKSIHQLGNKYGLKNNASGDFLIDFLEDKLEEVEDSPEIRNTYESKQELDKILKAIDEIKEGKIPNIEDIDENDMDEKSMILNDPIRVQSSNIISSRDVINNQIYPDRAARVKTVDETIDLDPTDQEMINQDFEHKDELDYENSLIIGDGDKAKLIRNKLLNSDNLSSIERKNMKNRLEIIDIAIKKTRDSKKIQILNYGKGKIKDGVVNEVVNLHKSAVIKPTPKKRCLNCNAIKNKLLFHIDKPDLLNCGECVNKNSYFKGSGKRMILNSDDKRKILPFDNKIKVIKNPNINHNFKKFIEAHSPDDQMMIYKKMHYYSNHVAPPFNNYNTPEDHKTLSVLTAIKEHSPFHYNHIMRTNAHNLAINHLEKHEKPGYGRNIFNLEKMNNLQEISDNLLTNPSAVRLL